MKILFDANTPGPLRRYLRGHNVLLAAEAGWDSYRNGILLKLAEEAGFDVLVTCDQSIPCQQNLKDRRIALVILSTNRWPKIRHSAARIAAQIESVQPTEVPRVVEVAA